MKPIGDFRRTAEADEIAVYVQCCDVSADPELTVRLDRPEREKRLAGRDDRNNPQLRFAGPCRRGTLAFEIPCSHFHGAAGKKVMPDGDFPGKPGLAVKVGRGAAV